MIESLQGLASAGQAPAEQQRLQSLLATAVSGRAAELAAAAQFDAALSLLSQARTALPNANTLGASMQTITAAREQALADQRAQAEQARQGQLAISAAPWAKVEAVVDAAGQRMRLPANASTPLLLTLPEGRYSVTLAASAGNSRKQESVQLVRGQIATLKVQFDGYAATDYLREVGW